MFFRRDDKTWLRDFTDKNCKNKDISSIRALKKWAKLTDKTDGKYLADYMGPSLWGDSTESLHTAREIINQFAPPRIIKSNACQNTLARLRETSIKKKKPTLTIRNSPTKKP